MPDRQIVLRFSARQQLSESASEGGVRMRSEPLRSICRRPAFALLVLAALAMTTARPALADDAVLMEPPTMVTSGAQQAGPTGSTAGPAPARLAPQLVEN